MASERRRQRIERLLDEAEEAVSQFDWTAVRNCAQVVLAFDPESADALDLLTAAERSLSGSGPPPAVETALTVPTSYPSPPTEQPTSFANGRYEVKRFLGEGGKKRVYLAQDTLLDREVAFALHHCAPQ